MQKLLIALLMMAPVSLLQAQQQTVDAIFSNAMRSDVAYENLRVLCETTAGRISGTPEAAAAVEYTRQIMLEMDLDSVYLQEVMVPNWNRGEPEVGRIVSSRFGSSELTVVALGRSVGTGPDGLSAQVVEVHDLDELEELGRDALEGKIVFFNRPADQTHYNSFEAYSGAVDQRTQGPAEAARYGA
ncbi:MAG: hypothetical protein ACLFS0_08650, partial [Bacteroidales bacterium]